ncbi:unnamed protein product [Ectocarpus sp. 6 AP-2014]
MRGRVGLATSSSRDWNVIEITRAAAAAAAAVGCADETTNNGELVRLKRLKASSRERTTKTASGRTPKTPKSFCSTPTSSMLLLLCRARCSRCDCSSWNAATPNEPSAERNCC